MMEDRFWKSYTPSGEENRAVAEVGANRAGQFMNLVPVFGIVLAVVFLDEVLEAFHIAGAALIAGGIWLATAQRGRAR